jgi:hypothetical protein
MPLKKGQHVKSKSASKSCKGICLICKKGDPSCKPKVGVNLTTNLGKYARDAVQFVLDLRTSPTSVFLCRKHQSNARTVALNLQQLFVGAGLVGTDRQGRPQQVYLMDCLRHKFKAAVSHRSNKKSAKRTHTEMDCDRETATTPSLLLPNTSVQGVGTRVPTEPVFDDSTARQHIEVVTSELLRQACGNTLPQCVVYRPTLLSPLLTKEQRHGMTLRVACLLYKIFNQKLWHDILVAVVLKTPKAFSDLSELVCKQIGDQFDLGFSLHVRGLIKASETTWRNLFHTLHYDSDNMRRTLPNGVRLPQIIHSWDATQRLVKVFRESSDGPRYKPCVPSEPTDPSRYVAFSGQVKELLGSTAVRGDLLGIKDPQPGEHLNIPLHVILGFDGKEMVKFGTVRDHSMVHGSWTFLQYGRISRSPLMRHLAFVITGKDSDPSNLKKKLALWVSSAKSVGNGLRVDIGLLASITFSFIWHLTGDLPCLFSWANKTLAAMGTGRCFRCPATGASIGDFLAALLSEVLFDLIPIERIHIDFPLHFILNWCCRVLRELQGLVGDQDDASLTKVWEDVFNEPGLRSMHVTGAETKDISIIGQHVDLLLEHLPRVLDHDAVTMTEEGYIGRMLLLIIPLLRRFELESEERESLVNHARSMAQVLRDIWPTPDVMFFYWHMADVELKRELDWASEIGKTIGRPNLSVGAFGCQGVESIGHYLFRAFQDHTNWLLEGNHNFVAQAMGFLELNNLLKNGLVGINIHSDSDDISKFAVVLDGHVPQKDLPKRSRRGSEYKKRM